MPTEKEWEWAARGGLEGKKFPWGNQPPSSSLANYSYKVGKPTPVGSYPANGYGLYDMAGNAGEWCQDQAKLRGGSWDYYTSELEVGQRNRGHPTGRGDRYGFRCVADLP